MFFASDNTSAVAPEVMAAIGRAAEGYAPSYGADALTEAAVARVREVFEAPEARVFFVPTGTAANALALACACPPWGTVYCHRLAHIQTDECNAPEFYTGGAKLTLLEGPDARIDPAALAQAIASAKPSDHHTALPAALSLTQATERGAAYTLDGIRALTGPARAAGLTVHMDGTRFAAALARTDARPAEMSWKAGVDILCLGATKCGAMAVEAVIFFDPALAETFERRRKRGGHLLSKMRFVAAQIDAWLADGLWLRLAAQANAMADRLAEGLGAAGAEVLTPPGANLMFARITLGQHRRLKAAGASYYVEPATQLLDGPEYASVQIRLVTSFSTTEVDVDRFIAALG